MIQRKNFQLYSRKGQLLDLSSFRYESLPHAPVILYLHGFKGFKDWGFVPYAGENLATKGFHFISMNFSHNGIGNNPVEFTELDKFRDNTFSLELEEALDVIGALAQNQSIGLIGHSRGGGIALLAARHPGVKAVCTWAAVSYFNRYPPEVIERWKHQGYLEATNVRTGQVMQLGWKLHEDLMEHIGDKLNIRKAVEECGKSICVIHGTNDEAVSPSDAQNIFDWAGSERCELHLIPNTGHTFGAAHPFQGSTPALDSVLEFSSSFFKKQLT